MSPFVVGIMLGVGSGVWVYNKLMRSSGGNTKNAATAAGIIGFVAFLFMWMIMNAIT
jgi:hypothetical protein